MAKFLRRKRQPTVGWLIKKLMEYPKDSLVVIDVMFDDSSTMLQNITELAEVEDKGRDSDYELQYIDSRRLGRKMVLIR